MPVPDLADRRPPYQQIAADLRAQIQRGKLQPGDRLPSNGQLAEEYSSSRETIRRALRVLTDEGLIAAHSTLGTFVLRPVADPEPSPEFVRLAAMLDDVVGRLGKVEARLAELENPGSGRR